MKNVLTNKYFIIGNLLLILLAIPVTLFFISRQQDLQSRAAPSSRLFIQPDTKNTSTQCSSFTLDVMVDPGQNIVSIVDFYITYDPTALDVLEIAEGPAFPTVVRPVSITSGEANMSLSVGVDVTRAIQSTTKVATITFRPKAAQTAQIQFDTTRTRVFSLAPDDEPTENVLSTTSPSNIQITSAACPDGDGPGGGSTTPTPSTGPGTITPTPTGGVGGGGTTPTPIASPTIAANQSPVCTEFTVSPNATGSAPFSVLFTAKGNDPDPQGTITKATFTFGDGQVQDVTEGLNLKDVTVQVNHTYQNIGSYSATVVFTDTSGALSQECSQNITTIGASPSATIAPTTAAQQPSATPTLVEKPTAAPTIPPTGGIVQTLGIAGVVLMVVVGGFLLLTL